MSGRPKYLIGNEPIGMPDAVLIASVSAAVRPEGKMFDFSMLIERPERASKSRRTWSTPWTEAREPSVKIKRSSAKHKWVWRPWISLAESPRAIEEAMESPIYSHREGWRGVAGLKPIDIVRRQVQSYKAGEEIVPSD